MKIVRVDKNTKVFTITLENENLTPDLLHRQLNNRRNKKDFKLLFTFEFEDELVELYGYKTGIERNINKLELPIENDLFYDDLIFCSKNKDGEYVDFDSTEFEDFYDCIYGGFEDIDSDDDPEPEEDDDYDYDDGFVVRD